ncbi:hypothetical protein BDN72DRAFT_179153 [Pluteus cervinus]|uniref:Uncharacterized protein n=1 Tax=Pluteus cervinus TaxID=181527 RepID=A0ACD3AKJ1_9AGAR|nr:hypothetical protein BDN72DRAFT_179153 [Pluteus cervinus]
MYQSALQQITTLMMVDTLMIYDWVLQFSEEVELIHKSRWTGIKVLYLICRYYPMISWPIYIWAWLSPIDQGICTRIVQGLYAGTIPFQIFPQAVFIWRAIAFTGRSKYATLSLGPLYAAYVLCSIWTLACGNRIGGKAFYAAFAPLNRGFSCYRDHKQSNVKTGALLIQSFTIDTICMVMIGVKCIYSRSMQGSLGRAFILQGVFAFIGVSANNLLAAMMYLTSFRIFSGIGLPVVLLTSNMFACRLIILIRRRANPTDTKIGRQHSAMIHGALDHENRAPPSHSVSDDTPDVSPHRDQHEPP